MPEKKDTAKTKIHLGKKILDAFVNPFSGFGGANDPISRTTHRIPNILLDRQTLSEMYRFDWPSRKVVDIIAEDSTREGITISSDDVGSIKAVDIIYGINKRADQLQVKENFLEALIYARLYGGSALIVGAIDGQTPDKPLKKRNIRSIEFLTPLDNWQMHIASTYSDPLSPDFGEPELYSIQPINVNVGFLQRNFNNLLGKRSIIHESRVIKFDGNFLPALERVKNRGWHDSVLWNADLPIKHYSIAMQSIAVLVQDFVTKSLKTDNLANLLMSDEGRTALNSRIAFALQNLSSNGIVLTGDGEEFTKIQTPVAGLDKILQIFIENLSGATGIPRARFWTQQLGKLAGATEETRKYFDSIRNYQKSKLTKPTNKMFELLFLEKRSITRGELPDKWSFEFNSLWQEDSKTQAETRKIIAETDDIYIRIGVILAEEVAASRFSPTGYSSETNIDFDLRKQFKEGLEPEEEDENELGNKEE